MVPSSFAGPHPRGAHGWTGDWGVRRTDPNWMRSKRTETHALRAESRPGRRGRLCAIHFATRRTMPQQLLDSIPIPLVFLLIVAVLLIGFELGFRGGRWW